jgi:small subunit ribosomal protein S6
MPLYEQVLIARQDVSQQQVETLVETFKNVITENGGSVGKTEYWGLRTMQYKVKKNRKGHYTLLNITADPAAVSEMERQMKLNEDIIRFMTVRVEEHEDGPSAIMQSRGRDDRRGPRRDDRGGRDDRGPREDRAPRAESAPAAAAAEKPETTDKAED